MRFERLRAIAAVSGLYDALVGVVMIAGRPVLADLFQVPLPVPPIHADLNGVFLIAVAVGYLIPYRDPESRGGRTYLWAMGPLLKGAGAAAFVLDYVIRHSPQSFLLFALSDGTLAAVTLWGLLSTRDSGFGIRDSGR
jgi:asparagine N-glycosylation enzyme membrane subunit Stt3